MAGACAALTAGCGAVPTQRGVLPAGVYRVRVTADELRAGGARRSWIAQDTGVLTLTIRDRVWTMTQREPGYAVETGFYQGRPSRITWVNTGPPSSQTIGRRLVMAVKIGDGWLRFRVLPSTQQVDPAVRVWFERHPWRRIG